MTEAEWLACADPEPLIEFLDQSVVTPRRKCRLLACAACYRLGRLLIHPQSLRAVQIAERWADGQCTDLQLSQAWLEAGPAILFADLSRTDSPEYVAAMAAKHASSPKPEGCSEVGAVWSALTVLANVIEAIGKAIAEPKSSDWSQESATLAEACELTKMVRDIFGNPFRPVPPDSAWLTSTVIALATGIYEERAFDRMPILADALQDAGCANGDILNHCRDEKAVGGQGANAPRTPHVRGCWVVDLLLGKE